jgi:hypothetical protein
MGSIRSIKTKAKAEERAAEDNKGKQWEQEYEEWLNDPDRFHRDHYARRPGCFGSCDPYLCPYPHYCQYECGFMDACQIEYLGYDPRFENDPRIEEMLWEEEYDHWIEEQSQE